MLRRAVGQILTLSAPCGHCFFLIQPPLLTRAHGISSLVQARSNLKRDYADEGRDATPMASESADDVDETGVEVRKRGRLCVFLLPPTPLTP